MIFDALIVDSNPFSRANLWQATLYEPNFKSVKAVSGLNDALATLQNGYKFDVLLITSDFSSEDIRGFVPAAKLTHAGKEAAYVVVLKSKDQDSESIANSIVDGTDGFLLEPFSVQSLRQVAAIAARVKHEHEQQRIRAAIQLMLLDMMPKFDEYAESRRKKKDVPNAKEGPTSANKEMKRLGQSLRKIAKDHPELFAQVAHDAFQNASPRMPKGKYKGASRRVKELEEKKKVP